MWLIELKPAAGRVCADADPACNAAAQHTSNADKYLNDMMNPPQRAEWDVEQMGQVVQGWLYTLFSSVLA